MSPELQADRTGRFRRLLRPGSLLLPITLLALDFMSALLLYREAWSLREPGWFIFPTPLVKSYAEVPHFPWLVAATLVICFQIVGLYQIRKHSLLRLLFTTLVASTVQMLILAQYHMIVVGGPEEFPRSVFAVFALLVIGVTLSYRVALWVPLHFGKNIQEFGRNRWDAITGRSIAGDIPEGADITRRTSELVESAAGCKERLVILMERLQTAKQKIARLDELDAGTLGSNASKFRLRRELKRETLELTKEIVSIRHGFISVSTQAFRLRRRMERKAKRIQDRLAILNLYVQLGKGFAEAKIRTEHEQLSHAAEEITSDLGRIQAALQVYYEDVLRISRPQNRFSRDGLFGSKEQAARLWLLFESFIGRHFSISAFPFAGVRTDVASVLATLSLAALISAAAFSAVGLDVAVEALASFGFIFLIAGALTCLYQVHFTEDRDPVEQRNPRQDILSEHVSRGSGLRSHER